MSDFVRGVHWGDGLFIYPICPECAKFLKRGDVLINGLDELTFKGWTCKRHGEVNPNYEYVDPADLIPVSKN